MTQSNVEARPRATKSLSSVSTHCVARELGRGAGLLDSGPIDVGGLIVECAGATESGRRASNDDEFLVGPLSLPGTDERAQVLLVADGMGGLPCPQIASCIVTNVMYRHLVNALPLLSSTDDPQSLARIKESMKDLAQEGYAAGEHALGQLGNENGCQKTPGSTLTAAIVTRGFLLWMHAGDTRCYLLREGKLTLLTQDHNVFALIKQAGVEKVNPALKSYLTNCLGADTGPVRVDVGIERVVTGDWVIVCSDGLTNTLPDVDIAAIANGSARATDCARSLAKSAAQRGAKDNVTVAVARVS